MQPLSTVDRLRKLNALLDEALDMPAEQRDAWLARLPMESQSLAPELRVLLAHQHVDTGDVIPRAANALLDAPTPGAEAPGDVIGPYRLLTQLGHGGMSTVWRAERCDGSLQREVALKLPHMGWAYGFARRMAHERDILASLEHPRIARLYDAGVTSEGRPWLAMECVEGVPIDRHCQERQLSVADRLRLFLQVTDAVTYAHSRLIVHRDLKPSNIFVTPGGEVRLLDFGVAKLMEDDALAEHHLTRQVGRPVTPDYAAPELLGSRVVGTAADVYSLGVVLFELLSGQRPYTLGPPGAVKYEDALLQIEVPAVSTRAAGKANQRALRGDLDTIVARTLKKEPLERYVTVEALAADIERFLHHEPVLARPDSRTYRFGRFVARNKVAVAAVSAVVLALVGGVGVASWQAREAGIQRARAVTRLVQAEAALEFAATVVTEGMRGDERLSRSELLDRSVALAEGVSSDVSQRVVATDLIGGWLINFDRYADVERILNRTLQSLPADFDDPIRHVVSCKLATALAAQGKLDESTRLFDQAIDASRDDPAILADCLYYRAQMARNSSDAAGALELSKQALRYFDAAGRVEPKARAVMRAEWALALSANGQPAAADREFAGAMRELQLAGRGNSTEAATMHNNWGLVLSSSGQPRAALSHYDRAVAIARTLAPDAEPSSTQVANQARILSTLGRYQEAREKYEVVLAQARRHSYVEDQISALLGLARIAFLTDDLQRSQRLIDEANAARSPAGGVLEGGVVDTDLQITQARLWQRMGRNDEARAVFTKMLNELAESGNRGSLTASLLLFRAQTFTAQNRSAEALADAKQALPVARAAQGDHPYSHWTGQVWLALAKYQHQGGRHAEARVSVANALANLDATLNGDHRLIREGRELAAELAKSVTENSPTAAQTRPDR
jgi:eukaryotic-like serine/threonine-protein kinase